MPFGQPIDGKPIVKRVPCGFLGFPNKFHAPLYISPAGYFVDVTIMLNNLKCPPCPFHLLLALVCETWTQQLPLVLCDRGLVLKLAAPPVLLLASLFPYHQ